MGVTEELEVLFEDGEIVVVNKPAGMLVHPHSGKRSPRVTVMSLLKKQLNKYVYPVHRLDKPVSGALIFALTKDVAAQLKDQWNTDSMVKEYLALCIGVPPKSGIYKDSLKNDKGVKQSAITEFERRGEHKGLGFVKIQIRTGRKHQIRRHFALHDYPILGDSKYGDEAVNSKCRDELNFKGLFLHASMISFVHPTKTSKHEVRASLPRDKKEVLENMGLLTSK